MLKYTELKREQQKLLAFTGLTHQEFQAVLSAFTEAYRGQSDRHKTLAGRKRKRKVGGGRRGRLDTIEQKLLFILVYQKTYPLQVVMGELFGMTHAAANQWIHRLLPIVPEALSAMGVRPEREGRQFAKAERRQRESVAYIMDGTERRRQRPKNPEKQALHYSGKKKLPSDKNVIVVQTGSKRVAYLSPTHAGKTHDKQVADQAQLVYPRKTVLHKDTGFQGYEPPVAQTHQPKKSRGAKH